MRASRFFISTLKEAPADADIPSQEYSVRAGLIKKIAAGVYTMMPMGMRVLNKIEAIIREEMVRAGSIELSMPIVQPAELWMESGRWNKYGPELLRFKDRHDRDFVIQPTSEEVITAIGRSEITSWRQMPVNFFQIRTKFRADRGPRCGGIRSIRPRKTPARATKSCSKPISASSPEWGSSSVRCAPTRVRSAAPVPTNSR